VYRVTVGDSVDASNINMWLFSDNAKSSCSCGRLMSTVIIFETCAVICKLR
jgi:hypothetical protein